MKTLNCGNNELGFSEKKYSCDEKFLGPISRINIVLVFSFSFSFSPCMAAMKYIPGKNVTNVKHAIQVCHEDCSDALPIPCVPMVIFSEKLKIKTTTIADHTPRTSPMVPALIVYCTIEIENRGLDSKGIYRTSGAQKDVLRLKVSKRMDCLKLTWI
ncbi:Rac GTPase-activating protein 1 [Armadillidium nasatum]|uniref:Rac GTPase-activating protein 1 n=1 Tax=Armadillidium nasatum TaxID=96803 RepID=A0A5N5SMK9_9CRUS|nr:Rac GTPase-activating protein 1 [Armadillidium nasatum]